MLCKLFMVGKLWIPSCLYLGSEELLILFLPKSATPLFVFTCNSFIGVGAHCRKITLDTSKCQLSGEFFVLISSSILCRVYLFLRERKKEKERGRGRGRQRIPSRLHTISTKPDMGLELMNPEMTWAEFKRTLFCVEFLSSWCLCPHKTKELGVLGP